MAKIADLLAAGRTFSFEFFPPKTDAGVEALMASLGTLRTLDPAYVSVTYGAGGSTRNRSVEIAKRSSSGGSGCAAEPPHPASAVRTAASSRRRVTAPTL